MPKVFAVICNVTSPQRLIDTAKVVFSMEGQLVPTLLVACRVSGMAAQTGVPEVAKMAYKMDKRFMILPTLKDVVDILNPDKVFLLVCNPEQQVRDISELASEIRNLESVALVVSGVDDGFSKSELGLGEQVTIKSFKSLPPPSAMAIALYILSKNIAE